jgi:hypothetical protein
MPRLTLAGTCIGRSLWNAAETAAERGREPGVAGRESSLSRQTGSPRARAPGRAPA